MTESKRTVLELSAFETGYVPGISVLHGLSFQLDIGERVALVGSNGAGKSALLLAITGFLPATKGSVTVDGIALSATTLRSARSRVAMVFADPDDTLFCATVRDEVVFGLVQAGMANSEALSRANEALEAMGLTDYAQREPLKLSLGEKKRLALAVAYAARAPLMLLDEPTVGLDPRARRDLIRRMNEQGGTLLFATHDLDAALDLSTRVLVLSNGRLVADGAPQDILTDDALLTSNGLELPLRLQVRVPA